jgi:hypothetical protein
MTERMRQILESKLAMRQHLATRAFFEKIALVEKLRDRSLAIAASSVRRNAERTFRPRSRQLGSKQDYKRRKRQKPFGKLRDDNRGRMDSAFTGGRCD